jgi:hypothetical protein
MCIRTRIPWTKFSRCTTTTEERNQSSEPGYSKTEEEIGITGASGPSSKDNLVDDAELYFLPKEFPPGWMAHSAYMPECVRIRLVIGQGPAL